MRVAVKNAADREQVHSADVRDQDRVNQDIDDLKQILSRDYGRRFLSRVLDMTGLYRTSFTAESGRTFYNEGQRSIGLRLLEEIKEADAQGFLRMTIEQSEKTTNG